MDKEVFHEFMKSRFYPTLNQYKERAFRNQQAYKGLQWIMIVFSTATAMLLGSEQFFDQVPLKVIALITSIIVSGLATALRTFGYQERWTLYNKMRIELESEFDTYIANGEGYSKAEDKESLFIMRVNSIINEGMNTLPTLTIPRSRKSPQPWEKGRQ